LRDPRAKSLLENAPRCENTRRQRALLCTATTIDLDGKLNGASRETGTASPSSTTAKGKRYTAKTASKCTTGQLGHESAHSFRLSGAFDEEGLSAGCLFNDAAVCKQAFENVVLGPSRMNPHTLTIGATPTGLTVLQAARACSNSQPSTSHNGRRTDMATSRNPSPRDWTWRELYVMLRL
jgi:hypothetical protein